MDIQELAEGLRSHPGLTRKACIGQWAALPAGSATGALAPALGPGDDAGAIGEEDGYLLLAAEGMMDEILEYPRFAGFACVTVCANDIYAMGGRPLGMVSVVTCGGFGDEERCEFLAGFAEGLAHYGVPLLGGHTAPGGKARSVSVAMMGRARTLMRGDGAKPGNLVLAALDLDGRPHPALPAWDTVTGREGGTTVRKLESIIGAGGRGLVSACRDISNPGLLGTLAMMLEASGTGATVDLDRVPVPGAVDLAWWLTVYPSFGFVLAVEPDAFCEVRELLERERVTCERIGEIEKGSELRVSSASDEAVLLDWRTRPVTGLFDFPG